MKIKLSTGEIADYSPLVAEQLIADGLASRASDTAEVKPPTKAAVKAAVDEKEAK